MTRHIVRTLKPGSARFARTRRANGGKCRSTRCCGTSVRSWRWRWEQRPAPRQKVPLPRPIMKFVVLNLPWPKGAPTMPMFVAQGSHNFHAERERCLGLIDELSGRQLDEPWPENPVFGEVRGREVSRLHAKHLNHHLRQFGV